MHKKKREVNIMKNRDLLTILSALPENFKICITISDTANHSTMTFFVSSIICNKEDNMITIANSYHSVNICIEKIINILSAEPEYNDIVFGIYIQTGKDNTLITADKYKFKLNKFDTDNKIVQIIITPTYLNI